MSFRGRPVPGRGGLLTTAPAPPPFAPTDLAGCDGWYDATDAGTISFDLSKPGTPKVALYRWADKSPAAHHMDNPYGAVTGTRTLNGMNAVEFVPPAAQIGSTVTYTRAPPLTWFAAVSLDTVAATGTAWIVMDFNGSPSMATSNGMWALYCGGAVVRGAAATPGAHVVCYQYSGATSAVWVDRVQVVAGDPGTPAATVFTYQVGSYNASFDGVMGEHIRYSRALTTPERQQVEGYLKAKWGTP